MDDKNIKVAVITGGSKGIGRSICENLAKNGVHVYFNYSSQDNSSAKETEDIIKNNNGFASSKRVDVSSSEQVNDFIKEILNEKGRIDILVNNAGVTDDGLIVMMKDKAWEKVIDVNLKGAFNCIRAVSRTMIKQKWGRIINISSTVALMGNPGQANYVASKAGLIGLTKSVSLELASRNITANVVAPGYIMTDMTSKISEAAKNNILDRIPMKRVGTPEDIASIVNFLASDQASYITGQVIQVNGGLYI